MALIYLKSFGMFAKNPEEKESSSFQAWVVWSMAGLFYLYEMVLRVSPSIMTHELMQDLQVSSTALGILSSFYYYAYVIFQIPCGLFIDKLGSKKVIIFSALLCIFGTFLFAESTNLLTLQIGRFLIGAGSSCAFISCLKVTAEWFKPTQFALIAGLTNMMGTIGATFGSVPLAMAVNSFGWRRSMFMTALAGIPIMVLVWLLMKDILLKSSAINQKPIVPPFRKLGQSLKIISMNKQIWLAGVIGGFMYLPVSAFTELWAVPFLMSSYKINNELASAASVVLTIGVAIGSPLAAWVAKKLRSYTKVMKLSTMIASLLFIAIAYAQIFSLITMFVLLFVTGLTVGVEVLCFVGAKHNSDHEFSGTTMAFINTLVMMSGVIFQPMLGWVLDFCWDGKMSEAGIRIYSHACYQVSILIVPVCLVFSWFLLRFLNDTYEPTIEEK